ncbi:YciI family protein [Natronoglycomyces albus]|uniref:YCII-related domain-containing protein n=1 Tax=Natronoglycomyces albus TaxID=2811108 RepID=A0A895XNN3_9ACTN|nr:YciI family protein [Natronoglycomyces albus]QSB05382.1 hypothetical protein JQS30_00075 [Natronoglycomyces albus]
MAHYAMMVWGPSEAGQFGTYSSAEEYEAQMKATGLFNAKLERQGRLIYANGMGSASASTVVDNRGPAPMITDGPYAELTEYINGFWIIEAADLDEALNLAAEASRACSREIEVRPMGGE